MHAYMPNTYVNTHHKAKKLDARAWMRRMDTVHAVVAWSARVALGAVAPASAASPSRAFPLIYVDTGTSSPMFPTLCAHQAMRTLKIRWTLLFHRQYGA